VGGKHRGKHDHKKPLEDKPAPSPIPLSEKTDARHCEAIHAECQKKQEPTKWWRSPEWWKAIADWVLAFFALGSFILVLVQLKDAREFFVRDQRPYLWPSSMNPVDSSYNANQKMRIKVDIADYGKSPAMKVSVFGDILIGPNALDKADVWFAKLSDKLPAEQVPNETFLRSGTMPDGAGPMFNIVESEKELTLEDAHFIFSTKDGHDIAYVLVMRLYYTDASGNLYHSDVCSHNTLTHQLQACKKHNEVK
jgi:hypothetical protein